MTDVAYAGDQLGNLWKFDLTQTVRAKWKVDFDNQALFSATDRSGTLQPITSAPVTRAHPEGGLMLVFGTGRNLTMPTPTLRKCRPSMASMTEPRFPGTWTVWRSTKWRASSRCRGAGHVAPGGGPTDHRRPGCTAGTDHQPRSVTANEVHSGSDLWTVSNNSVDYKHEIRLVHRPAREPRARASAPEGVRRQFVEVQSVVPGMGNAGEETCDPGVIAATRFLTTIDAIQGARPRSQIYGYATPLAATGEHASRLKTGQVVSVTNERGDGNIHLCGPGKTNCAKTSFLGWTSQRPSWRQLR